MKDKNNILQRARNYDLTETELESLHSDSKKLNTLYDEALAENITEDLFIPGNAKLLELKKKEIENLTKDSISRKKKQ